MPQKHRKLHPLQLTRLAREVTAAARAIVDMAAQMRAGAGKGPGSKLEHILEPHHLTHDAKELNSAVRAVVDLANPLREELFLAAKEERGAKTQKRKDAPKCGAWKAAGGQCGTLLEAGQFRCALHAGSMRVARLKRARAKEGGQPPQAANSEAVRQEKSADVVSGGEK